MAERAMLDAIEAMGGENVAGAIAKAFACMEIAEEEIKRAMRKHWRSKEKRVQLNAAFRLLFPGPLTGFGLPLYRAHVREMLERVEREEDTRSATKAEVLAALSTTSLRAPLDQEGCAMAARLFADLYPHLAHDPLPPEPWAGNYDEALRAARQKLRKEERR